MGLVVTIEWVVAPPTFSVWPSLGHTGRWRFRVRAWHVGIGQPDVGRTEVMVVPDRFKTNAYRILGISANATLSEIHKAAATKRRAAALGLADTTGADVPLLGEVPRSEADIRNATARLENPVLRLSDRLFWFHLSSESPDADPPSTPAQPDESGRAHDEALRGLFAAFVSSLDDAGVTLWVRVIRNWHRVVANDDYWALSLAHCCPGDDFFVPRSRLVAKQLSLI